MSSRSIGRWRPYCLTLIIIELTKRCMRQSRVMFKPMELWHFSPREKIICLALQWLYRMLSFIYIVLVSDLISLYIVNFFYQYLFCWMPSPSFTVNDMVTGVSYNLTGWYTSAKLDRWLFNAFDVSIELLSSARVVCFS